MSTRNSGYDRENDDKYQTPAPITRAVLPHLPERCRRGAILEPCAGDGKMVRAMREANLSVYASDIRARFGLDGVRDFLRWEPDERFAGVVTNPPYNQAAAFVEHALRATRPHGGFVAMLFKTEFDHAQGRKHLFRDCPQFARKVVLDRRVVWFPGGGSGPSTWHAWFVWDWRHEGPPTIAYGEVEK